MAGHVVAIVGENANGILEVQSRRFGALLPPGLTGHVLRITDPGFPAQLEALLREGVRFAWGYAGVGARLQVGGRSLWDAVGVPFVSVLADAPYIMPPNHHVPAALVANGYVYGDWLDMQRALVRAPQVAALLPLGVMPNPGRHRPLAQRAHRMMFVKSGSDPARQRAAWSAWPPHMRAVLHDCAGVLADAPPGPILPVVQACLASRSLVLDGRRQLLFGLLHELDTYVRALRATAVARALLPLPATIIGTGWEHLPPGRARVLPALPAAELDALYADTAMVVNTTPNLGSGAHERVLRGFAAGAHVASDLNSHARAHLADMPALHGFEWQAENLTDGLAALFASRLDDGAGEAAATWVERQHSPAAFLGAMAELAELVRLEGALSAYAPEAA